MRPTEDDDLDKADQYVEVDHAQNKDEHSKVIVRPFMLEEFEDIKEILDVFDHQLLNTIPPFTDINPSAENIARVCFDQLKEKLSSYPILVKKVIIWETDHCGASFYESSHPRGSGDPL